MSVLSACENFHVSFCQYPVANRGKIDSVPVQVLRYKIRTHAIKRYFEHIIFRETNVVHMTGHMNVDMHGKVEAGDFD